MDGFGLAPDLDCYDWDPVPEVDFLLLEPAVFSASTGVGFLDLVLTFTFFLVPGPPSSGCLSPAAGARAWSCGALEPWPELTS